MFRAYEYSGPRHFTTPYPLLRIVHFRFTGPRLGVMGGRGGIKIINLMDAPFSIGLYGHNYLSLTLHDAPDSSASKGPVLGKPHRYRQGSTNEFVYALVPAIR